MIRNQVLLPGTHAGTFPPPFSGRGVLPREVHGIIMRPGNSTAGTSQTDHEEHEAGERGSFGLYNSHSTISSTGNSILIARRHI
ncbi:MAG: hypothetical protein CW742_05920 [Methanoregula sp.]|nr:MAG: hypothetical protein CW742_05920 [Methanoregula sp.]